MKFTRRISKVTALCTLAVIACASIPPSVHLTQQYVSTPLLDNALDFLYFAVARRAGLEGWFCLKGYVEPRTSNAILQTISPIYVDSADGANIIGRPDACRAGGDSSSVIGTVHFHPSMNACEFSATDIITAHHLPYQIEAIVCRDDADTLPHLLVAFRREIDSAYTALMSQPGGEAHAPRIFTPTYRFLQHARPDSSTTHR